MLQSGTSTASAASDYTVKVELENLPVAKTIYYRFQSGNDISPTGQFKTINADSQQLKLAVISCSDYSAGFYNAYRAIAGKPELDAVLHLGDYIYEGTSRRFDNSEKVPDDDFEDIHFNKDRKWWLHCYRRRYAINRLDPTCRLPTRHTLFSAFGTIMRPPTT
jgi:alkaline phosphatase D